MTTLTTEGEKPTLAYTFAQLAFSAGCSVDMIQRARKNGELSTRMIGSKPVVEVAEAQRWIKSLPQD
jgi:hypothetical protein